MKPKEYEMRVASFLRDCGYIVTPTGKTGDRGVDLIAERSGRRIAVQVKMFGQIRRVNAEVLLKLFGGMRLLQCDGAALATNGEISEDARSVAKELEIDVFYIPATSTESVDFPQSFQDFDHLWQEFIFPLKGRELKRDSGKSNTIVDVDWSGIHRITSSGRRQTIPIEIFKKTIQRLVACGSVTRNWINQEYEGRASSGICLILSQVPNITLAKNPMRLIWNQPKT